MSTPPDTIEEAYFWHRDRIIQRQMMEWYEQQFALMGDPPLIENIQTEPGELHHFL